MSRCLLSLYEVVLLGEAAGMMNILYCSTSFASKMHFFVIGRRCINVGTGSFLMSLF